MSRVSVDIFQQRMAESGQETQKDTDTQVNYYYHHRLYFFVRVLGIDLIDLIIRVHSTTLSA